jgi:hypothetical protein
MTAFYNSSENPWVRIASSLQSWAGRPIEGPQRVWNRMLKISRGNHSAQHGDIGSVYY